MRKLLCTIAALGIAALGQGVRVDHQVTSTAGAAGSLIQVIAIPNALTYVCSGVYTGTPCTSAGVTVYADSAMTEAITQPLVGDGQGNITNDSRANGGFYVASLPIYWTTTPPQGSPAGVGSNHLIVFHIHVLHPERGCSANDRQRMDGGRVADADIR
jgi:hypothetical protein